MVEFNPPISSYQAMFQSVALADVPPFTHMAPVISVKHLFTLFIPLRGLSIVKLENDRCWQQVSVLLPFSFLRLEYFPEDLHVRYSSVRLDDPLFAEGIRQED